MRPNITSQNKRWTHLKLSNIRSRLTKRLLHILQIPRRSSLRRTRLRTSITPLLRLKHKRHRSPQSIKFVVAALILMKKHHTLIKTIRIVVAALRQHRRHPQRPTPILQKRLIIRPLIPLRSYPPLQKRIHPLLCRPIHHHDRPNKNLIAIAQSLFYTGSVPYGADHPYFSLENMSLHFISQMDQ